MVSLLVGTASAVRIGRAFPVNGKCLFLCDIKLKLSCVIQYDLEVIAEAEQLDAYFIKRDPLLFDPSVKDEE
jgi:hypothetical protein